MYLKGEIINERLIYSQALREAKKEGLNFVINYEKIGVIRKKGDDRIFASMILPSIFMRMLKKEGLTNPRWVNGKKIQFTHVVNNKRETVTI
jgi:hypothetical protein